MKKIIILIYLFTNLLYCQEKIVIDKESKNVIEFATILFYENEKFSNGIYSDINGKFILPNNINKMSITCIGYKNLIIFDTDVNTIELEKQVVELDEIILTDRTNIIGKLDEEQKYEIGISKGLEVGAFIVNSYSKKAKIKKIKFYINKINFDIKYRIHFYNSKTNSLVPNEELMQNNSIFKLKKNSKGLIVVDIENENIILPENGIYVTIECLDGQISPSNKYILSKKESTFRLKAHKSFLNTYIAKNTIKGVGWLNFNDWIPKNYKLTFNKDYDLNKLYVPTFGIEFIELN
jgi:hypothetical protein